MSLNTIRTRNFASINNVNPIKNLNFLPSSMTCNIGILSNFFSQNYAESDWFLEDYNNVMINKIKNTFEHFKEPERDHYFPSLPTMDFPEPIFA